MNYTNKQQIEMYLDWFNNYLSTTKFREDYNLGMAECENILDSGRELSEKEWYDNQGNKYLYPTSTNKRNRNN